MLFGYPITATSENWLHECLCETLQLIHTCIETGKSPPAWPILIPETYRNRLRMHTGLKKRLKTYQTALAKLNAQKRQQILQALNDQKLNEGFTSYLREFGNYCKSWDSVPTSTEELIDAIKKYTSYQENNGFKDRAFLKAAVFRMLHRHCKNGDERLIQFIKNVVGVSV